MENKNQTIIISLLTLIVGLILGYFFGVNAISNSNFHTNESMHEEVEGHMYDDEIIDGDGAMMHAMDEMMLVGRGETGEAYEEAWLRGMVVHHLGAINMAEELLEKTNRPELVQLANDITESQSKEVEQMKEWLNAWFDNN